MFCRNCGAEILPNAAVCTNCGVPVGAGNHFCPNCRAETAPEAMVCVKCGIALNTAQGPVYGAAPNGAPYGAPGAMPPPVPPMGYTQKSKIAAGILGILLGCFGVHNFYLGYVGKAIAQLLITVLSCGILSVVSAIWGLIEGIMILVGSINVDGHNIPLSN